jgi:hypothetical protein
MDKFVGYDPGFGKDNVAFGGSWPRPIRWSLDHSWRLRGFLEYVLFAVQTAVKKMLGKDLSWPKRCTIIDCTDTTFMGK